MSSELWDVHEHTIPASHPRGFSRGVRDEETSRLRLCVKQYVPKSNPSPQFGDVTLILAHSVSSTKESYEPLFDELLLLCPPLRIRSVWSPDIAWHGASFRLNAPDIGDSPHWDDSARDLLQLVNHFQTLIPLPIFAIGLSWGCYTILRASLMHPRLFTGLVSIDPVIGTGYRVKGDHKNHRAAMMARRKDRWRTREDARKALLKSPYYAAFDPRVFERVMEFDLIDVEGGGVELTTPKAMELANMMRESTNVEEIVEEERVIPGFHRPEASFIRARLPDVASPCLYVWGTESDVAFMEEYGEFARVGGYRESVVSRTGIGAIGTSGLEKGRVQEIWVPGVNHPIPLEKPKEAAEAIMPWLVKVTESWKRKEREEMSARGGQLWVNSIDPEWMVKISKL